MLIAIVDEEIKIPQVLRIDNLPRVGDYILSDNQKVKKVIHTPIHQTRMKYNLPGTVDVLIIWEYESEISQPETK